MAPEEMDAMIGERVGGGGGVGQDYQSWRYNIPEGGGTAYPKSRRKMRMEEEYRKYELENFQQQKAMQEMEAQAKQMEVFDLDARLKERQLSVAREEDIFNKSQLDRTMAEQEQAFKYINSVRGQPNAYESASEAISGLPFAAASEPVQKALWALGQARQVEDTAKIAQEQKAQQQEFFSTQQSLLESGVSEQELPKFYDTKAPPNVIRFDPDAVSKKLGTAKFQEKQAASEKKEETPKSKVDVDIAKAYGELNEILLTIGESSEAEQARVRLAGVREAYKKITGEDAPEILPRPTSGKQYDRLPSGTPYIGKDGKIKTKQ
jgi:uncharacterized membrane protein